MRICMQSAGSLVDNCRLGRLVEGHFAETTRTFQQYVATPAAFVVKVGKHRERDPYML